MANGRVLTLAASVRPDGRPHLSPTDFVARANPAITIMLADGSKRQAILEGNAVFLDMNSGTAKKVLEAQKKKYGWVTDSLAEFQPVKVFTWKAK